MVCAPMVLLAVRRPPPGPAPLLFLVRYPFLLVDRVLEWEYGKYAVGYKLVSMNENFFCGHFPQRAIMPGVGARLGHVWRCRLSVCFGGHHSAACR